MDRKIRQDWVVHENKSQYVSGTWNRAHKYPQVFCPFASIYLNSECQCGMSWHIITWFVKNKPIQSDESLSAEEHERPTDKRR